MLDVFTVSASQGISPDSISGEFTSNLEILGYEILSEDSSYSLDINGFEANGYIPVGSIRVPIRVTIDPEGNIDIKIVWGEHIPLIVKLSSPADLRVIDPSGKIIDKEINEIPDAIYSERDIDGDGDLEDEVIIPTRKVGDYQITIIPEADASPADIYTVEVSSGDTKIILAENVPVGSIPEQPYIIESTETGVLPPWDINQDKVLDISDLVIIGQHFGETIDLNAQPNPDVNRDGTVDILDLVLVSLHFGENYGAMIMQISWR